MSTLNEVLRLEAAVRKVTDLVGVSDEFFPEFNRRIRNLGVHVANHHCGGDLQQAAKLPVETPLGPAAETKFTELRSWLHDQSEYFAQL